MLNRLQIYLYYLNRIKNIQVSKIITHLEIAITRAVMFKV